MIGIPPRAFLDDVLVGPMIGDFARRIVPALVPGVTIVSWYRDPVRNAAVGGLPESQHQYALALDLGGDPAAIDQAAHIARRRGLVVVRKANGLHVQLFPRGVLARAGFPFPRVPDASELPLPTGLPRGE